nr:DUF5677 domain-containing protein [Burkholderia sp. Se-20373]
MFNRLAHKNADRFALLDDIGKPGTHQDIDLRGLAEDIGASNLYTVLYRALSQDAHPSATSLQHHVEVNAAGKITGLHIGPDYVEFADTLLLAACSLLLALDGFVGRFGTADEKEVLSSLVNAYRELNEPSAPAPDSSIAPVA